MKEIGAVTIGKLIEAHYEKDEHKFKTYAEFIAEVYKEKGEEVAEKIIRSKIDGSYKNKPAVVALDNEDDLQIYCPDVFCEDCTKEDCTVRKLGLISIKEN